MILIYLLFLNVSIMASMHQMFEYKGATIHWIEFEQGSLDLVMDPEQRQKLTDIAKAYPQSVVMNGSFFSTKENNGHQVTYYFEKEGLPFSMAKARHGALGWTKSQTVWDQIFPKASRLGQMQYRPKNTAEAIWQKMQHIVVGVPLLIDNGIVMPAVKNRGSFYQLPYARSVVAQKDNGHLVFVVVETGLVGQIWMSLWGQWPSGVSGRGLSLADLAIWLKSQKIKYALNLDGGGSVGLAMNGSIWVRPRFKWQDLEYERGLSHFLVVSNHE